MASSAPCPGGVTSTHPDLRGVKCGNSLRPGPQVLCEGILRLGWGISASPFLSLKVGQPPDSSDFPSVPAPSGCPQTQGPSPLPTCTLYTSPAPLPVPCSVGAKTLSSFSTSQSLDAFLPTVSICVSVPLLIKPSPKRLPQTLAGLP